jgi:hypothetical protein
MPRNLPLHENAPPLILLDNRAAVRSDERLEIFAMTETIKLTDGTELPLDNHWRTIATQEASSMVDGGRYVHPSVSIAEHNDGRVVVFSVVKDRKEIHPGGGELFPTPIRDQVERAVTDLSHQYSLGKFLLESCMRQFDSRK